MGKVLVAYFSAGGTTERVAHEVARAMAADVYEIVPKQRYTAADLDWRDSESRSSVEMDDESCRPAIEGDAASMGEYDTVLVGFPIWWYIEPRIIDTFLESYDFSGKTLIPFATSGGSGIKRAELHLARCCPGATWRPGRLLSGGDAAAWAESLL